jgi:ribosomal protein S18 acetylase RimI-like enzyme
VTPDALSFRRGELRDADTIAAFNSAMALETEGKALIPEVIGAGVRRLIGMPSLGFYVVAEHAGEVIGCLLVTHEWSDWRNGLFWWIQSVYVKKEFRRRGVYRRLYGHVGALAQSDASVCGFRLYVEKENEVAHATYASLGMKETAYLIYEELKPGIRFLKD